MPLTIQNDSVPLCTDSNGVVRVGETRVLLDLVIFFFNEGHPPEVIVNKLPVLKLADVYAVVAYYLNHKEEVDAYIEQGEIEAEKLREELEGNRDTVAVRERLRQQYEQLQKTPS